METAFQISAIAIITALACCTISGHTGVVSGALSVAACVLIMLISIQLLAPVMSVFDRLKELSGLSDAVIAPVFKVAAVSIVTQIAGTVCEDAGEKTLQKSVEIAGVLIGLYASLPLITATINLLEEMLDK